MDDDEFDIRESYPAQERVAAAEGWDDPAMDAYNDYVKAKMLQSRERDSAAADAKPDVNPSGRP